MDLAAAIQWIIPIAGIAAVLFAGYLARDVLRRDTGTEAMRDVASTIYEGAVAFIRRQYTTIGLLALVGAVVIGVVIYFVETPDVADVPSWPARPIAIMTAIAFLVGAVCSMASGIIGMFISVKSNVRTAAAARRSLVEAVQVAMRGGAVSGFLVVALSLLGVWGIFSPTAAFVGDVTVAEAPFLIVGFGFGASFVALFAQLGGGIYTKAADVGSDLVGKVEAGIPEDDPRNAGVDRGPGRRQRRRLRRPWRRPVRVDRRREHRRDDPRRRVFADRAARPAGPTPRPGSSSRSWCAASASWPRSWPCTSSAAARTRIR